MLIGSNDNRFGNNPLKFVNDLDVDGNIVYFIDSSNQSDVNGLIPEVFNPQPKPTGRLFKLDESTGQLNLLLDNLFLPHGLVLTPNKDALLINEITAYRISRFLIIKFSNLKIFVRFYFDSFYL